MTAFKSAAGPSLITMSTFLTSRLGLGAGVSDVSSLLTIAGSPAYAMVGAAAVLSALYRAPLTGSLLLFELTKVRASGVRVFLSDFLFCAIGFLRIMQNPCVR